MRIDAPHHTERFGAVRIHGVQEVWELDSGRETLSTPAELGWQTVLQIPAAWISDIERQMAIVVPCKNERLKVIDGVLSGIPHDCLIVLVSNSSRYPIDRFEMEVETVDRFCKATQRAAVMIHQGDTGLGEAFASAGFDAILDDDGLVSQGKGEGMIAGVAMAELAGRSYVGFVDADNYVPGAVHEYIKAYAAGFHLANTPFSMVRISWKSKPKIVKDRLFFNRWGRTSQVTNQFLNQLISDYSGFGTEVITTGNAGEHALSLELALRMHFGAGFSVEPYEYLNLFEQFGGVVETRYPEVIKSGVEIFQIETRNPHFHENKGNDHVQGMRLQALNTLYHSPICTDPVRDEITSFLINQGQLIEGEEPPIETVYPSMNSIDWKVFADVLFAEAETLTQVRERMIRGTSGKPPISPTDVGMRPHGVSTGSTPPARGKDS
jgi:mannosyl-3-phosphoglycerate synthase